LGRELVEIAKAAAALMVSVRFTDFVCTGLLESVTVNVSGVALTVAVGVPAIAPVVAFSERPAGNVPDVTDQEYGVVPPLAASVALYAVPTWPLGRVVVVIAKAAAALTVSVRLADFVCAGLLVSVTVNVSGVALTVAVGVPVIAPVVAFSERPAGSVPDVTDQEYGVVPPAAVSVALYAVPTCPLGRLGVVIDSGAVPEALTVRVRFAELVCAGLLASVTVNVRGVEVTAVVGVPVIAPVDALNESPAGSVPEVSVQVYGAVPPVAVSVVL